MSHEEFQLLLGCARSEPDSDSIRELAKKGINWSNLLDLAEHHGVRPMLRQSLKAVCWDLVPQPIQLELERLFRANAQRSLLFASELLQLFAEFADEGVPAATFKGIILAEMVYGDLSLREFSDLDIIVHEVDIPKVEDILTSRGYVPDFPDRNYRSAFLAYQGQYAFRNKQTGFSVDLHWRLSTKGEALPVNSEDIWSRLQHVRFYNRKIPTFAHDDLALLLAAHGTKEGWRLLKWVCDFAEILRKRREIDWVSVLGRAERSHCSRPLQLAMVLASTLLEAPAPRKLIDTARKNPAVRALAEKAQHRMLRMAPESELEAFLNGLSTHDRLRHQLWPVARLLTTRTVGDYRAMPLPKSLWSVYYVTRPFRLAAKAAELVIRRNQGRFRSLMRQWRDAPTTAP
jgi:Uncharacterised nucleotidyltransferase